MATLNELAYNIKNIAYGGNTNTEQNVSTQQIKFWIHYYRAQIIGELIADGRGVPIDCYQILSITQEDDHQKDDDWQTYHDTHTSSSGYIIPFSGRTADDAGLDKFHGAVAGSKNVNALDLTHSYFFEEPNDYGIIRLRIPHLVTNNSKHGLGRISVVSVEDSETRRGSTNVSIVTRDEATFKQHNRFTHSTPTASMSIYSSGQCILQIDNLLSVNRGTVGGYDSTPKSYAIVASALLKNPTENNSWTSDDLEYPLPQEMISDLNRRILGAEMQASLTSMNDPITDNADTTKNVQPQAQR